jgi:hypothetical protein
MITRRVFFLGMATLATGVPALATPNVAAKLRPFAGYPTADLRQMIEELDFARFQAHACLRRDHMMVWHYAEWNPDPHKLAHAESVAELRLARLVLPADAEWHRKGVPMWQELQTRNEDAHFPEFTLDGGESYRSYIQLYDWPGGASYD